MPLKLLLASASPARLVTLRNAGIEPSVFVSSVDEDEALATARARGIVTDHVGAVLLLARVKAEDVEATLRAEGRLLPDFIVGCDSMLELDGEIMGKPNTAEVAKERWLQMRGRSGLLHTGHWLIDMRGQRESDPEPEPEAIGGGEGLGATSTTKVHFADLSEAEIDAYIATGEPLKVAGAFTIDGLGGAYVRALEGDHHGVVGISLPTLRELLARRNVAIHEFWDSAGL